MNKMDVIIKDVINPDEIMKFEEKYKKEEAMGCICPETQFEYAWCLVRSPYADDWKTGFELLKKLYDIGDDHAKRDYLYYMAIAKFKMKKYDDALEYCQAILKVQPQNHQVKQLKAYIESKMKKEGLLGMAVIGGAGLVLGIGAAALAAIAVASKK
uniref:Mitochondrial fission 1 protein n=1 Tax=Phallusia mammillata TaxID=59560 RepID=A0A6F9DCB9_9ASCI|nr:mitochondrial fission 1 protein-like [Phallusia mammillata]